MANSFTALGFIKPEVGADTNLWGGHWNSNADLADAILENFIGTTTTKLFKFDISAIGTTTQRTMTFRDQSITVAGLSDINTNAWAVITTANTTGVSSISFPSISTSFNHLMLIGRVYAATNTVGLNLQFYNSIGAVDGGANYYWQQVINPILQGVVTTGASPASAITLVALGGNNAAYGFQISDLRIMDFQATRFTLPTWTAQAIASDDITPVLINGFGGRGTAGPITGLFVSVSAGVATWKCTLLGCV